ncbi:hypothetical protein ZWY2020_036656 [Hordeum vulgare]|nr:hypothetical protein ZWY2020_036656 [Hordeum vulgare]
MNALSLNQPRSASTAGPTWQAAVALLPSFACRLNQTASRSSAPGALASRLRRELPLFCVQRPASAAVAARRPRDVPCLCYGGAPFWRRTVGRGRLTLTRSVLPLKRAMLNDCATMQRLSPNRNDTFGFGSGLTGSEARETEKALLTLHHGILIPE